MCCGSQHVVFGSRSPAAAVDVRLSPERPSIRVENSVVVSNTQCCMRDRTQLAALDGANLSLFRFRVSGSPRPNAVASNSFRNCSETCRFDEFPRRNRDLCPVPYIEHEAYVATAHVVYQDKDEVELASNGRCSRGELGENQSRTASNV